MALIGMVSYRMLRRARGSENMVREAGVDRLGTWTYRGGYGTIVAAPEPLKLWDRIGENYRRVLKK